MEANLFQMSLTTYATGGAVSFDSSQSAVAAVTAYLTRSKVALMWTHPSGDLAIFAYSPASPEWAFLQQNTANRFPDACLLMTATSYVSTPIRRLIDISETSLLDMQLADSHPTHKQDPSLENKHKGRSTQSESNTTDPRIKARLSSLKPLDIATTSTSKTPELNSEAISLPVNENLVLPTIESSVESDQCLLNQSTNQSPVDAQPSEAEVWSKPATISSEKSPSIMASRHTEMEEAKIDDGELKKVLTLNSDETKAYFRDCHGITFETFTIGINWSKSSICLFCLRFGRDHQDESKAWSRFLQANGTIPNNIYDTNAGGWDGWRFMYQGLPTAYGVIITHESRSYDFSDLPGLANVLHNRRTVTMFSVDLSRSIQSKGYAVTPLFPSGGAVLLTEATMVQDPDRSIAIIRWFIQHIKIKPTGTWKLYMRPRVNVWLRDTAMSLASTNEEKSTKYFDMLLDIGRLFVPGQAPLHMEMPPHLHDESLYDYDGGWTPDGDPIHIVSPASLNEYDIPSKRPEITQEMKNENTLMDFFASSTLAQARTFRKFYAVTPEQLKDWKQWTHVRIIPPEKFCRDLKIQVPSAQLPLIQRAEVIDGRRFATYSPYTPPLKQK